MAQLRRVQWLVVGVAIVVMVAGGLPAQAQYTKLYQFTNTTGASQSGAQATVYGFEALTAAYAGPVEWTPGSTYTVFSGLWSTVVYFWRADLPHGTTQTIGWTTADNSCYLLDLRYLSGTGIAPDYSGGVPGGGGVEWDDEKGAYVWTVTNDTGADIQLSNVQVGTYTYDLDYDGLSETASEGGVAGKRVADIDLDIVALTAKVLAGEDAGEIPGPAARSLLRKLDKAAAYKEAGLAAFNAGDVERALVNWERARHQVENFVSEVTNQSEKGNVPHPLADELIADARAIIEEQFDGLSAIQNLSATGVAPPTLEPGTSFSFAVPGAAPGVALVLSGSVLDDNGQPVLNWVEQAVIPLVADTTPPTASCTLDPTPSETGWNNTDVTANLTADDESGVFGIYYAVYPDDVVYDDEGREGLEFHLEGAAQLTLGFAEEGIYEITYLAADNAGNTSEPQTKSVKIDKAPPVIEAAEISPPNLWSPDHTLREMTLNVTVTDSNPAGEPTWYIEDVASDQPENGTGDGDEAPDWVVGEDGQTLWLRSERAGGGEVRTYTITLRAVDVAGNVSEAPWLLYVRVEHDQGG